MKNILKMTKAEITEYIAENQKKQTDDYVIENRGFISPSKAKEFEKSKESFFRKYILEESVEAEKDTSSLQLGTIVDDYITLGEGFYDKYFFSPEKFLKKDIWDMVQAKGLCTGENIKDYKVDELKEMLVGDKTIITPAVSKQVLSIISEWGRQPLFDFHGDYKKQQVVTTTYKGLILKAKLDRFSESKGLIRDMKTTNNIDKFIYQVGDYGYDFSMAFYNVLCKIVYKKDFVVVLDVCQTSHPYPSESMIMPKETLGSVASTRIMPTLNALAETMENWEKTHDPKVWLDTDKGRDEFYKLDMYPIMEGAIQKEFTYIN